jgi:hypothetical protein
MKSKTITITRRELTTYSVTLDLSEEFADKLLNDPDSHQRDLERMCKATDSNWLDAEDPEFEVEEYQE